MDRQYYLDLAARGLRMPIGTDLVLHEQADVAAILLDGERLGKVYEQAAKRWRTPLAVALMDLALEKDLILARLGVPAGDREAYHFAAAPSEEIVRQVAAGRGQWTPRIQANLGALAYVATRTSLVPVGMTIGPFSLMTKLIADPITPVYMAGAGVTATEDGEVKLVEAVLELGTQVILESVEAQAGAGAAAILIAEPAASNAYFSPKQLATGTDIYRRYVMQLNQRIAARIRALGMEVMFHCCGELTNEIVREFGTLEPVLLSLGSSRKLWEDAALLPKDVVLFGNLPSKKFYSDESITVAQVEAMTRELITRMRAVGHPFILGSECDVLSVPGVEATIRRKVKAMLQATCS